MVNHMRILPLLSVPAAALVMTACAAPSVTTTPAASPPPAAVPAAAASSAAHAGSTISLAGNGPGEKLAVTLVKVHQHVAATEFETPGRGHRFASVQLRVRNTGTGSFSDSMSNEVVVVDQKGQSYDAAIATGVGCPQFADTEKLAPGDSGLGCVVFEVPRSSRIVKVQVTMDSGEASQTGEWTVGK
jgi:hypothetical protein